MDKILILKKSVLLGTLIVVCLSGCGKDTSAYIEAANTVTEASQQTEEAVSANLEEGELLDSEETCIYVYVCGEIQNPGVYTLPTDSRICDAFEKAGGFTENAATDYWNQARILVDGEMLYVPTVEEAKDRQRSDITPDGVTENTTTSSTNDKVNINTASMEELMTVPGIGEAKARAIIAYRHENGFFSSIEEIKNVEGIKDGVFEKIKAYIDIN